MNRITSYNVCYTKLLRLPDIGFNIASLIHTPSGKEFLFQPHESIYRVPRHGDRFIDYDASGCDDMLPTVDTCIYPGTGAFPGRTMPDHGGVWIV